MVCELYLSETVIETKQNNEIFPLALRGSETTREKHNCKVCNKCLDRGKQSVLYEHTEGAS